MSSPACLPSATAGAGDLVVLMGVLNLTPDSFSDGGKYDTHDKAVRQAHKLIEEGADVLDLGAESTRPGAVPVTPEEEWARIAPVLKTLVTKGFKAKLSVDTRHPTTMLKAIDAGATMINNVAGLADHMTLSKIAKANAHYVAMHMHRDPPTMQKDPLTAKAALSAVNEFFASSHAELTSLGFTGDRIWLDPGIGFGKSDAANARLLLETKAWSERYNLAIGVSRKSFLGRTLGITEPNDRDAPGAMLEFGMICCGAKMIRTHSPKVLKSLLRQVEVDA